MKGEEILRTSFHLYQILLSQTFTSDGVRTILVFDS
jgi:hypothetical protein